jgi:hypothetical protein
MEQWEKELREKLQKKIKPGIYDVSAGKFVAYTGMQGKIDFEVELERAIRKLLNKQ